MKNDFVVALSNRTFGLTKTGRRFTCILHDFVDEIYIILAITNTATRFTWILHDFPEEIYMFASNAEKLKATWEMQIKCFVSWQALHQYFSREHSSHSNRIEHEIGVTLFDVNYSSYYPAHTFLIHHWFLLYKLTVLVFIHWMTSIKITCSLYILMFSVMYEYQITEAVN